VMDSSAPSEWHQTSPKGHGFICSICMAPGFSQRSWIHVLHLHGNRLPPKVMDSCAPSAWHQASPK
ncbi:hypothetical protein NDU88_005284, partial [Pleurodeles waltl]